MSLGRTAHLGASAASSAVTSAVGRRRAVRVCLLRGESKDYIDSKRLTSLDFW